MESNNIYKTYSVYEQLKGNEQLLLPNMSYVEDAQKVCLYDEPLEIEDLNYFYIEALEDDLKVAFTTDITENVLQYSTDKETWHTLNPTYNDDIAGYSLEDDFDHVSYTLPINANEKIWFKGKLTVEYIQPDSVEANVMPTDVYYETFPVGQFYISKPCNIGGNIFSLTYGDDFTNKTKFKDIESFNELFAYNNIVDASNLILPATKLTQGCYEGMFGGCTSLMNIPELPATKLADFCYSDMFSGCTSLVNVPELHATTLAYSCYQGMFSGCTSLTTAPELNATELADYCYDYMFSRCTSLTDIRINVSDEFYGFHNTFNYCESLSNVYLIGDANEDVYSVFEGILEKNINVYCTLNTYAVSYIPSNYTINITDADFIEYKSLVLNSANNVNSKDTYTIVEYTITETYNKNGEIVDIEINKYGISSQFEENTSSEQIERTVSFTYKNAITAETTITQGAYVDATQQNYLCITALTSGIFRYNNPINKTLYYSQTPYMYADGSGWVELNEIELFAGQSIYIKGNGVSNGNVYNNIFYSTCKFDVSGNIMSLIYGDDFEDKVELTAGYDFKYLFADVHIVDASQLILPATTLANYCYYNMFSGCTSLVNAPSILPATVLASNCYAYMFFNCASLVNAPSILPATVLATNCYAYMFYGCSSFVTAPELPATKLTDYCYESMFINCTSLTHTPELPATTLADYCYHEMFSGCTSLTTAPQLPATSLASSCYYGMFRNCSSLTTAPELPTTTAAWSCYNGMFSGCTSLTTAPELPATTISYGCYQYMFSGCTSLINAPELPATALESFCYKGMFSGCTSLTTAPKLPATVIATNCYINMFTNCSALNNVQQVFIDEYNCYGMFDGVCETGTIILDSTNSRKDINEYLYNVCSLPKTWTVDYIDYSQPLECKSLSIVPQNEIVGFYETSVKLNVTMIASYITTNGIQIDNIAYTYTDISNTFEENTEYNDITRTISYNKYGVSTTAEVTQLAYKDHIKQNYMYITALENCTIYVYGSNRTTVYYSTTNHKYTDGSGWRQLGGSYVSLNAGETIYIKGSLSNTSSNYGYLSCSNGKINVGGNIMSLIYGDDFEDKYELPNDYAFYKLFDGCKKTLVDASQLILPATTLTESCYQYMFNGCTSLINGPKLPATTLARYCYAYMFYGCTSLTCMGGIFAEHYASHSCDSMFDGCTSLINAPYIASTKTLGSWCCLYMFRGCTSLMNTPKFSTTILVSNCYNRMFSGCTSLTTAPELPATTLAEECYYEMFSYCTSLTTAPELPATTLANTCYGNMFRGCTSLVTAPELPATTLADSCYMSMFRECTSLTTAPELSATILATSCYASMFGGCTSLVNTPQLPATILVEKCYNNMFGGCTSLITAPELPATTLAVNCYLHMFTGCTSLTTAPELPATILDRFCYSSMFNSCTSLTTAPELPATTLINGCYSHMFYGCTSLTTAPELHATTLASDCYDGMFLECKNLNKIIYLGNSIGTSHMTNWVSGVASTGTFVINKNIEPEYGDNFVPDGWTVETIDMDNPIKCYELYSVTADNIKCQDTKAKISYSGLFRYASEFGTYEVTKETTGTYVYSGITVNETSEDVQHDITFTLGGKQINITVTQLAQEEFEYPNYLCITSLENNNDITFDGCSSSYYIESSTDNITYVNDATYGWKQTTLPGENIATLNTGDSIYIRGNFRNKTASSSSGIGLFRSTGKFNLSGNIMSLLDNYDFENADYTNSQALSQYQFVKLFGNTSVVDVSQLILPATTITTACYSNMFIGCTSLTTAPQLPATTLADSCYGYMFNGCTSLVTAPALPATTLATQCYKNMFGNCTSLVTAPELPATTLANSCYEYMLQGCKLLTTAPQLPATTLANSCYRYMFYKCTSLTTAPQLPATTVADSCYAYMFEDCTSLTTAPELPATTLATNCYYRMFRVCTSLTNVPSILPATTLAYECYKYMFSNCVSLTEAPQLPATTLADSCYYGMFEFCTSLTTAPELPATTLASYCYSHMFYGCSSLVNIPSELPATTLAKYCYQYMFYRCISLVTAPKLLGAALTTYCYQYMFYECRKLSNITMLASSLYSSSMYYWVYKVASTGTFYKHPSMTSLPIGTSGIPSGWTVVDYGEVVECTSLTITAPNVSWRATNTTITYTAIVNIDIDGTIYSAQQTGTVTSEEFPQNMDPNNTVEHTLSYTYMGITATTTITQGVYSTSNYTINLNNQWQLSTKYSNLDESQYDGIYESFSNYNKDSTNAVMYINISGYTQFRLYIGSYGESSYDYTIASTLDGTSNYVSTSGFQYKPTSLNNFKEVVYSNIDGGEHTITITYRKDGSQSSYDDRGYLLIPKDQ